MNHAAFRKNTLELCKEPWNGMISDEQWKKIVSLSGLSGRETQVCQLIFRGQTRNGIADQLGIGFRTVRQYMEQIHVKLRVNNRTSLVLRIIQLRDFVIKSSGSETTRRTAWEREG